MKQSVRIALVCGGLALASVGAGAGYMVAHNINEKRRDEARGLIDEALSYEDGVKAWLLSDETDLNAIDVDALWKKMDLVFEFGNKMGNFCNSGGIVRDLAGKEKCTKLYNHHQILLQSRNDLGLLLNFYSQKGQAKAETLAAMAESDNKLLAEMGADLQGLDADILALKEKYPADKKLNRDEAYALQEEYGLIMKKSDGLKKKYADKKAKDLWGGDANSKLGVFDYLREIRDNI